MLLPRPCLLGGGDLHGRSSIQCVGFMMACKNGCIASQQLLVHAQMRVAKGEVQRSHMLQAVCVLRPTQPADSDS